MTKKLIIVESPAKARTIKSILGPDFIVESSVGHIRDLPRSRFGIRIEDNFEPEYVTISGKQKIVNRLIKAGKSAEEIYLAADPDREGEAICWHLKHYLENETSATIRRILYYEITRQAVLNSLKEPSDINGDKVNAQQARRVLDRIVGYQLSPFLWKKVKRGLSAGRVQSVALKLIVDREREIEAFRPEEYWSITVDLSGKNPPPFKAAYHGTNQKKRRIPDRETSESVVRDIGANPFSVHSVERKLVYRQPPAPFITSTLQQEAARRHRFPAQKTMRLAQALYEGKDIGSSDVHGLITYMRTDSPRISKDAQAQARMFIDERYGTDYIPPKPPVYKARKSAQEAHEAIRPTDVSLTPDQAKRSLTTDELKLYTLVWERFVASQMAPAAVNMTTIRIASGTNGQHEFRATGLEISFEGFYRITGLPRDIKPTTKQDDDEPDQDDMERNQRLPSLLEGELLNCLAIDPVQNFTKPPARYSEATLVKELESRGIGRPSTYAAIMATIRSNDYAMIRERRFHPTELGMVVVDLLVKSFPDVISVKFTAEMENRLDDIEQGNVGWQDTIAAFYAPFKKRLKEMETTTEALRRVREPAEGMVCPECGNGMHIRWGKRGRFLSCEKYPECKGILPYEALTGTSRRPGSKSVPLPATCPECSALLALKKGKFGIFVSCSRYPACKAKGPKPEGLPCAMEGCAGKLIQRKRKGRRAFYGCSAYPECTFVFTDVPVPVACSHCGNPYHGASEKNGEFIVQCPRCKSILDIGHDPATPVEQEATPGHGDRHTPVSDVP
ncbi:type I DNA topoisomerase [bacterium]|nr:type I DNA topoisomerase [candidate division CSSED10-310 bacterium]